MDISIDKLLKTVEFPFFWRNPQTRSGGRCAEQKKQLTKKWEMFSTNSFRGYFTS